MDPTRLKIIETAQRLFYTRGYAATPVAAIIDAVGIAKGTFYHHFESKDELLQEMVNLQLEALYPVLASIAEDVSRPALDRLRTFFTAISQWKTENRALMMQTLRVLFNPKNLQLRFRMYAASTERFAPLISRMVEDGVAEGTIECPFAEEAGTVVYGLSQGLGDTTATLTLGYLDGRNDFEELWRMVEVYMISLERIIGAPEGALRTLTRKDLALMMNADETKQETEENGT